MFNPARNRGKYLWMSSLALLLLNMIVMPALSQDKGITVELSGNVIDISYNHVKRLTGGRPLLENKTLPHGLSASDSMYTFGNATQSVKVSFKKSMYPNITGIYLSAQGIGEMKGNEFFGLFFSAAPGYKEGVTFYRYKPWNAWTKPVKIKTPDELETWDNQCFYWRYQDGTYGIAIPISDHGYRTTLGSENKNFGCKALSYVDGYETDVVPAMVIGFGDDLYQLLSKTYETAVSFMGSPENLRKHKKFPEPFEYVGWCTWNASSNGAKLNEETIIDGVKSFTKNNFPLGWVLIDDGWFDHENAQLRSIHPDTTKFPNGFSPLIKKLKTDFHLKHVGVWHAFNGYWHGIDPASKLGERYNNELFSWKQRKWVDVDTSSVVTYYFIKPGSDSLEAFYDRFYSYLKKEGFSFVKVDNQLVVERMSPENFAIGNLANAMHTAVNASAKKYFNNAIINCMDMTSDAYYNFGLTPVARSVEDYFPYKKDEDYNLQHGNAAAHILQGVYNNLYFSQLVFPDLDMFQSHNPNAEFHAIARAINSGPIYITDEVGKQNFDLLKKLILHDGKIILSDEPLLPAEDCLFQVQDRKPFKAFSKSNGIGLLGVWNCADADEVSGTVSAGDVNDLSGEKFALYESLSGELHIVDYKTKIPVSLKRMAYKLYYVAPLKKGVAPLGLLNKYNAPATIANYTVSKSGLYVNLKEGGRFGAVLPSKPKKILVNGKKHPDFTFEGNLCIVNVTEDGNPIEVVIKIR